MSVSGGHLTTLPTEILYLIACFLDFEDPRSLSTFVQTCTRINSVCHELLAARRNLDKQYRVIHDRHPLNVPKLLKLASEDDSREAWHVERAEFWCHRPDFDSWCVMSDFDCFSYTRGADTDCAGDGDHLMWQVDPRNTEEELNDVLNHHVKEALALRAEGTRLLQRDAPMCRTMLENLYGVDDEALVEREMEDLRRGREDLCKALLLPLCRNLDTIVFLERDEPGGEYPLYLLALLIQRCYLKVEGRAGEWYPGFRSLRKISVHSETDARGKRIFPSFGEDEGYRCYFEDVLPLFLLPGLKVLRLGAVKGRYPRTDLARRLAPTYSKPGTSSVEALEFAKCELDMRDTQYLLSLPRRLRYLQTDDYHAPMHLRTLYNCPRSIPESLERLNFRSTMGYKLWVLANYTSLKHLHGITADSLVWPSGAQDLSKPPAPTGPQARFILPFGDEERVLEAEVVTLEALELTLPPNVETLSIHIRSSEGKGYGFIGVFLRELLRNVLGQAADECHTGADFANLREVTFLLQDGGLPHDFEWDHRTLADLEARGISVSHKQIISTTELPVFEDLDVDESKWEHCFEDRHYTDARLDVQGYNKKYGMVRSYVDHSS